MTRKPLLACVATIGLTFAGATIAQSITLSARPRPAPAPLLAAGIPAFAVLGVGALAGRLLRRRGGGPEGSTKGPATDTSD
jgi:hypothetical protein